MKQMLAVLALVGGTASAAEFHYVADDGSEVRLFDRTCAFNKEKLGGYYKPKFGAMIWGCWEFLNDNIHFSFNNGETWKYPWAKFTVVTDGSEMKFQAPKRPQFDNSVKEGGCGNET